MKEKSNVFHNVKNTGKSSFTSINLHVIGKGMYLFHMSLSASPIQKETCYNLQELFFNLLQSNIKSRIGLTV